MTDEQIERMKKFLVYDTEFHLYWKDNGGILFRIKSIGEIHLPQDDPNWEPGPVAFLEDGFMALWNTEHEDILLFKRLEL